MDSQKRSIAKTFSWRIWATIITTLVVLGTTGEIKLAIEISLIDTTTKLFAYFVHERIWNKITFGRAVAKSKDF